MAMRKRHAIVQEWLDGGNDAGGCIAKLEAEIETLKAELAARTGERDALALRVAEAERLFDLLYHYGVQERHSIETWLKVQEKARAALEGSTVGCTSE